MAHHTDFHRGMRVSVLSIAWTIAASGTEVVLGITNHVLTLVVFGAAGLLDAAGSAALVAHFRHAIRHEAFSDRHEQIAARVIGTGLVGLGVITATQSIRKLTAASQSSPHQSAIGIAIAALSIAVLPMFAATKWRVGRRVGSDALVADGSLSASGAILAALALAGAALGTGNGNGRWWVDPTAALVIAVIVSIYGVIVLFNTTGADHDHDVRPLNPAQFRPVEFRPVQFRPVQFRDATNDDVDAIAALHADSWRRTYRGSYSDVFLDGDVFADRSAVWGERLAQAPRPDWITIVAHQGDGIVGFAHTILSSDPQWGALLDNLHVTHTLQGHGLGTQLLAHTARAVLERAPDSGLYLWVLVGNTNAQAFYAARGGTFVDRKETEAPGGGMVTAIRVVWPDPSVLLEDVDRPRDDERDGRQ